MINRMMLFATIVGVTLFVSDLALGWMTFLTGPIPVVFVITIIVGIIAGQVGEAIRATLFTWFIGILISCLLAPIVFAEFWTDEVFLPLLPLIIMMWSTRGMFIDIQVEGNVFEVMAVAAGLAIIWLIITPVIYLMSFAVAAFSGFIGKKVHERLGLTQTEMLPLSVETQEAQ